MSSLTEKATRGTLKYMAAHACLMGSGYVIAVVLGRGLGPALYGVYGIIYSVLLGVELMARLGIPQSLSKLIAEGDTTQTELEASGVTLTLIIYLIIFVAFFLSAPWLASVFRVPDGAPLFRIAAVDIPLYGLYFVGSHILNGRREFGVESLGLTVYALTKTVGMFLLILIGLSVEGALIVNIVGSVVALAYVVVKVGPASFRPMLKLRSVVLRLAVPVGLFGLGSQLLPRVDLWSLNAIGASVLDETKGLYVAALNLARLPNAMAFVMTAVLLPSISRALAQGDTLSAQRAVQGATRFLAMVLLPVCVLTAVEGEGLLTLLFSDQYRDGAPLLVWLVFAHGFFSTLLITWSSVMIASGQERMAAIINLVLVPVAVILNFVLIPLEGASGAAIAAVVIMAGGTVVTGVLVQGRIGAVASSAVLVKTVVAAALVGTVAARIPSSGIMLLVELAALVLVHGVVLVALGLLRWGDLQPLLPNRVRSNSTP